MTSASDPEPGSQTRVMQTRDSQLVSEVNGLDMRAGLRLMELHSRPALDNLDPDAISAWRTSEVQVDGTAIRHVYATLKLHWLQRQENIGTESLNATLHDCYALLSDGETENPFAREALLELERMKGGETKQTRRDQQRICDLAETQRSTSDDLHTRAALGQLIVRNTAIDSESKARSFQTLVCQVAEDSESAGDRLGRGYVLLVLGGLQLALSKTPADAQEGVRKLADAAESLGRGGDFAGQGAALSDLATLANRGNFSTPANDAAEELLLQARDACSKAGQANEVKVIDQVLSYASPPNSGLGLVVSIATLGLLTWAFIKGLDALLFFAFLGGAILIHEGGHAMAAGLVGIPIRRFRVGIGTRLFGFTRGKTRIEFCLIPFMGYVMPATTTESWQRYRREAKAASARGEPAPSKPELDLTEEVKPYTEFVSRPRRLLFFLGGLAANFVVAVLLLWGHGAIKAVEAGKPVSVRAPIDAAQRVITVGAKFYANLPQILAGPGEDRDNPEKKAWIRQATRKKWWNVVLIFAITNCLLLYFNLLPVPPLDGAHVLLTGIEAIRGRDLSVAVRGTLARLGYVLIVVLILLNIYHLTRDVLTTIF